MAATKNYEILYLDHTGAKKSLKVPPLLALEIGEVVAKKYCGAVITGQHAVAAFRGHAECLEVFWGPEHAVETYYGSAMSTPAI